MHLTVTISRIDKGSDGVHSCFHSNRAHVYQPFFRARPVDTIPHPDPKVQQLWLCVTASTCTVPDNGQHPSDAPVVVEGTRQTPALIPVAASLTSGHVNLGHTYHTFH